MKKLLNTLYVTNPDYYLRKEGRNISITLDSKTVARYPIHILKQIVCFNYMGMSPDLMKMCMEENVAITFLHPMESIAAEFLEHLMEIFIQGRNNIKCKNQKSPWIL